MHLLAHVNGVRPLKKAVKYGVGIHLYINKSSKFQPSFLEFVLLDYQHQYQCVLGCQEQ